MSDPVFRGEKSNAPGTPGKARSVELVVSSAGTRVRLGDTLQLKIQNETGANITNEATYRTTDRNISVTGSGLIHGLAAGPFSISIDDAAGGTAKFEGQVFA
jgi:hypothetical protein